MIANISSGSLLKAKKTIKAKILESIHPSKLAFLSREYYAFQSYLKGNKYEIGGDEYGI